MDNSLKVGQYFLEILNDNEDLQELLGEGKIWPVIVTDENAKYPLIVYTRDSITPQYTKKPGGWSNQVILTYKIYATNYDKCVEMTNIIRNLFEFKNIQFDDIKVSDIRLTNAYEAFIEDTFLETLTFSMWIE